MQCALFCVFCGRRPLQSVLRTWTTESFTLVLGLVIHS